MPDLIEQRDETITLHRAVVANHRRGLEGDLSRCRDQHVYTLRRQINACTAIACLPPEILAEIFSQYAELTFEEEGDVLGESRFYLWIRITHICHFWRKVAIVTPTLWSDIAVTDMECVREMLRRSKEAPLSVKANLCGPLERRKIVKDILSKHTSRIHHLELQAENATSLTTLFKTSPTPRNLQTFVITDRGMPNRKLGSPVPLLGQPTPFLQYMKYTCSHMSWNPNFFRPTLRQLILVSTHDTPSTAPTVEQVLGALKNIPLLEELVLEDVLSNTPPSTCGENIISLPCLKFLRISASALICSSFITDVSLPHDTSISLACELNSVQPELNLLITVLMMTLSDADDGRPKPIQSLSIDVPDPDSLPNDLRIQCFTDLLALVQFTDPDLDCTSRLDLTLRKSRVHSATLVEKVCDALPLQHVSTFHISNVNHLCRQPWLLLAGHMPSIRGLRITGNPAEELPEVLMSRLTQPRQGVRRSTFPFPQLRTLMLESVNFEQCIVAEESNVGIDFYARLVQCLITRRQGGSLIRKLMLQQCILIIISEVLDLKRLVPELQWDGYELKLDEMGKPFDEFEGIGGKRGDTIEDIATEYEN